MATLPSMRTLGTHALELARGRSRGIGRAGDDRRTRECTRAPGLEILEP